jgi:citrate lyase subunit beta/citryl-CoA lyase
MLIHPRDLLLDAQAARNRLPVCDHYCGVESRIRKSLVLKQEMVAETGLHLFDITLDCEDGAPVGGEHEHALMVAELIRSANAGARVAVRIHAADHSSVRDDIRIIVGTVGHLLTHLMIPKVESVADVDRVAAMIDAVAPGLGHLPLHALIESPMAVHHAFDIASHRRVQSLSFGLMDFVSAHGGAIPSEAMGIHGQFSHPLVVRAKMKIAAACHAHGKVPSHCVVTEFNDVSLVASAVRQASQNLGFTRMWSIHPSQIRPIIAAFAPNIAEVERAQDIIALAAASAWAPIKYQGTLHDRASYRYFWQVLERAHQTGLRLPAVISRYFEHP